MDIFFPPILQKIIKNVVPREELFFLSFLVQPTKRGRLFKITEILSTNSFIGEFSFSLSLSPLSLSLSLSRVFVVAFHQTHLIPVKDRQTGRQTDRHKGRQTDVCLCLSLSVSFVCISRREFDVAFFLRERIETPPPIIQ